LLQVYSVLENRLFKKYTNWQNCPALPKIIPLNSFYNRDKSLFAWSFQDFRVKSNPSGNPGSFFSRIIDSCPFSLGFEGVVVFTSVVVVGSGVSVVDSESK
jgi:hypothetical protein